MFDIRSIDVRCMKDRCKVQFRKILGKIQDAPAGMDRAGAADIMRAMQLRDAGVRVG